MAAEPAAAAGVFAEFAVAAAVVHDLAELELLVGSRVAAAVGAVVVGADAVEWQCCC